MSVGLPANEKSNILSFFDNQAFATAEPEKRKVINSIFSLLGENDKYITGTYTALLKRPDLFGSNAATLLYALDVGRVYRKDALLLMFGAFLQKPPKSAESNIIFSWAEHIRKSNEFLNFEPVFPKLNRILQTWLDSKMVVYKGRNIPIARFRPILYNAAGVNVIDIVPYIAYIFTYHAYGYPYHFSEGYSSSSLKSYLNRLENWFAKCYTTLYKDQGITSSNDTIDDATWKDFYSTMLKPESIVGIRDSEIRETEDMLTTMAQQQEAINDADLADRFNAIISSMMEIAVRKSVVMSLYAQMPPFDDKFYDVIDLSNLVTYVVSETAYGVAMDTHDFYRYNLVTDELPVYAKELEMQKPSFGINKLSVGLDLPFCSGDIMMEMFKGYFKSKFLAKRQFVLEDDGIYITSDNLSAAYQFALRLFVNAVWAFEQREMQSVMALLKSNQKTRQYLDDMFAVYDTIRIVNGVTLQTVMTPIYFISLLNEFILKHCESGEPITEFNPFLYLRQHQLENNRLLKIRSIIYSTMFLQNAQFVEFLNEKIAHFRELVTVDPIIVQPYVQTFGDATRVFALGGCDTYKYLKYTNPIVRGYGFLSHVNMVNEDLYISYIFGSVIKNNTVLELIEDTKDEVTIRNTLASAAKKEEEPPHLFKFVFTDTGYSKRPIGSFVDIPSLFTLLKYAAKQTSVKTALPTEVLCVKPLPVNDTLISADVAATENGFKIGDSFITITLNSAGMTKNIPVYNTASRITTRNVTIVKPEGRKLVEIITPSTSIEEMNNLFWIFTNVSKKSLFSGVRLQKTPWKPSAGQYMITERIQPIPKR